MRFITKHIAGNLFLCTGSESLNLNFLSSASVWVREEEGKELPLISLLIEGRHHPVYLSLEGDRKHKGSSCYHHHNQLSTEAFEQALEFFGLELG